MRTIALLITPLLFVTAFAQGPSCFNLGGHLHKSLPPVTQADNLRSDTINVLKYTITLNITDLTTDTIRGNCVVRFAPRMNNINTLSLDLLKLTVDSIEIGGNNLTYSYNDTLIIVNLPFTHNTTDTSNLTVYYKGPPIMDASGWGGWYSQNNGYIYNLGVGFAADPHVFGRIWFPCFDNFIERSKYEFNIETNGGKIAYCNGYLANDTTILGNRIRKWILNEEIPSYLASVAVASYTHVNWTFSGMNGNVPVMLTAVPADTVNLKNSFANLDSAFAIFERKYGPYMWNRVGFCLVPFGSGAMEHATNISYPKFAANGTLQYETLMAHEFSHHWWGDLATCETAGDMWINEGMAVFSEFLFTEGMYGWNNYISDVRYNHEAVIHYAHNTEGGYRSLTNMPQAYTYGDHTYKKGADVAHTMRSYLGDSLFFLGLQYIQNNYQFTDIDAIRFRDAMTTATGVNMIPFFNGWVLNGGFPHFSIDSMSSVPNGPNFDVTVHVRQKLTGAPSLFTGVPLEISFRSATWVEDLRNIVMNNATANYTFTLPFNPVFSGINIGSLISDAKTCDYKTLKTVGNSFAFNALGRMRITVQNSSITTDSALIYVEHNWTAPDPFLTWGNPYRITPARYWKVSGIFPSTFDAAALITYDGRTTTGGGAGYLDNGLLPTTNLEDSIVLLYRPNTSNDWQEYNWYTKSMGVMTDKYGTITIDSLLPGEYTIGRHDYVMSVAQTTESLHSLNIFPNPANEEVVLECLYLKGASHDIQLYDVNGKLVYSIRTSSNAVSINTSSFENGLYHVTWKNDAGVNFGKLVVLR